MIKAMILDLVNLPTQKKEIKLVSIRQWKNIRNYMSEILILIPIF